MAEGAPLLREYVVMSRIEGSNPSLSAIFRCSEAKDVCRRLRKTRARDRECQRRINMKIADFKNAVAL